MHQDFFALSLTKTRTRIYIKLKLFLSIDRECQLNKNDGAYPLIAKINYLTRYSPEARSTFLNTFEVNFILNFFSKILYFFGKKKSYFLPGGKK